MSSPDGDAATSRDAFHRGRFELIQPRGWGLRAGLDAMLLAATIPERAKGAALDLGAGTGAAGFAAAVRAPGLTVTMLEREPATAALLRQSLALGANAGFAARLRVVEADLLVPRPEREAAGLADGSFDLAITNPPFHPAGGRLPFDPRRSDAVAMPEPGFLERWIRTAAAILASRGVLALVARPDNLPEILSAAEGRLGDLRVTAVFPGASGPANRILVHARKGSRAPLRILHPVVLRDGDNAALPIERALGEGRAAIDLGLL